MFTEIVFGVVLMGILPCNSQNQRFLAIPIDDDGTSTPKPQSRQPTRNNHLPMRRPQNSGNLHSGFTQNSDDFIINIEPQLVNQQGLNNNFGRTQLNTLDQQQFQNFPTIDSISLSQPLLDNQHLQRTGGRQFPSDRDLLNIVMKPTQTASAPINTFVSVDEPTLGLAGISEDALRASNSRSFANSPVQHTINPQQTHLQIDPFVSHQIQPQIQQHIIQPTQPQFHSNFDPYASLRLRQQQLRQQQLIQQQLNSPMPQQIPQQISQHIPQQVRSPIPSQLIQPSPQLSQPTHRPRIHRPSSRNSQQQRVNPNPQIPLQPEFLINQQANLVNIPSSSSSSSSHRFASSRNTGSNLRAQSSSSNLLKNRGRDYEEEEFRKQAESAKYSFASQIDDSISGNHHQREEVRDGLNVKGAYSYSDGYVKRTVFYEADDKGYRVVREEEEPLGDGPQVNPNGQASVSSYIAGNAVQYSITSDDIQDKHPHSQEDTLV